MALGKNIGKLMRARGLSYGDVARGIEIADTQPIWALVERNSKKSQFAAPLAEYFKVPLDRLLAEDFDVDEPAVREPGGASYDGQIKISKNNDSPASKTDAEKLLVVIQTFLDTDAEGRTEILKAATAVSEAHGATSAQSRRAKRR